MNTVTASPKQKIIVSYPWENSQLNFKKSGVGVVAERIFEGKSIQYQMDASVLQNSNIPKDLKKPSKKILWLFNNQYIPHIQSGKIVFEFKNNEPSKFGNLENHFKKTFPENQKLPSKQGEQNFLRIPHEPEIGRRMLENFGRC